MKIIKGKIPHAKKITIYGSEGIGKSTFASRFPEPIFIDTEGSTKEMDVSRFEKPTSWTMLLEQIKYTKEHPDICKTLVVDTIDWAEQMCVEHICSKHRKDGLESFGYGSGYIYVREEFGRFLNSLEEIVERGVNVVLIAHAQLRKFEQPDEMGAYDRWELKLGKKTASQISPLVKEWSDALLFANYKTYSVATDDKGKKHKAQGGTRVMYTAHHPCWDAKNRYGLPEEVPFEYGSIAHIISSVTPAQSQPERRAPEPVTQKQAQPQSKPARAIGSEPAKAEPPKPTPSNAPDGQLDLSQFRDIEDDVGIQEPFPAQDQKIPKALRDLMELHHVDEWELQNVVAARGYYPSDVPIRDYDTDFINGCLIGAWNQVHNLVKEMRQKQEIPFNN